MLKTTKQQPKLETGCFKSSFYSSKGGSCCPHVNMFYYHSPATTRNFPQSPSHHKVQKTMDLRSPYHPNSNFPLLIPVFINLLIYGTNGKDPLQRVIPVFHTEMYAANGCFSFLVSGCCGYSKMPLAADWVSFCCLYFMFSWLFPVHTQY